MNNFLKEKLNFIYRNFNFNQFPEQTQWNLWVVLEIAGKYACNGRLNKNYRKWYRVLMRFNEDIRSQSKKFGGCKTIYWEVESITWVLKRKHPSSPFYNMVTRGRRSQITCKRTNYKIYIASPGGFIKLYLLIQISFSILESWVHVSTESNKYTLLKITSWFKISIGKS